MATTRKPFEFTVAINDVVLDAKTISSIEGKLGTLMLNELAKLDLAGPLVTKPLPTARSFDGNGGGLAGMHIGRE
ncbi:MAG: hypothetical protein V4564_11255 [Pseudomonadota bacterium]|uniref:hypothetical protein n=1 Tax=Sphingomonas sp. ERG5 TaxID=1381597 RepID=UPI00054BA2A1|nr:hypothetical protein [Sphingomonas sp. ERG5]